MRRSLSYMLLSLLLGVCMLLSSCSILFHKKQMPPTTLPSPAKVPEVKGGLVLYSASNIYGYENAPIYVDSDFVNRLHSRVKCNKTRFDL